MGALSEHLMSLTTHQDHVRERERASCHHNMNATLCRKKQIRHFHVELNSSEAKAESQNATGSTETVLLMDAEWKSSYTQLIKL